MNPLFILVCLYIHYFAQNKGGTSTNLVFVCLKGITSGFSSFKLQKLVALTKVLFLNAAQS